MVVRVRDLNGGHLRFHFPILWDQNPPFFVDAALGVSRDAPLVDGGYRAAIGEDSDPLSLQQQRKRRIHFRRDDNALEHSTASALKVNTERGDGDCILGVFEEMGRCF